MKTKSLLICLILFPWLSHAQFSYVTPVATNHQGSIVGDAIEPDWTSHGFLSDRTGFHILDCPFGFETSFCDINDRKQIVGIFVSSLPDGTFYVGSFLYDRGRWTELRFPGAQSTQAIHIDEAGRMTGIFLHPMPGYHKWRPFLYWKGKYYDLWANEPPNL